MSISNVSTGSGVLDDYKIDHDRFESSNELGKEQFLELLVTQMKNQDPLSPQENGEFIAQLAQFSTVEGIGNLNASMEMLLGGYQSSQALQASSLVGRTVIVPSDQAMVDPTLGFEGQLALPASSPNVFVNVYDEAGTLVDTVNMGSQEAGMHDFQWDGKNADGEYMPSGAYRFEAMAAIDGEDVQLATLLPANVDSVTLSGAEDGGLLLNVAGLGSIALSSVYSIQ
ncbi:basal-body rod modification protein FlgD [Halopseudomonas oceani]|uniref:Basal-body rod modification protein FlgD n=1 Tax=Halopseudomonas oceani TaxID=1708783 RepID=A0A2P4EQV6_9GAMM|nr:flagellar hook assembly protein FlgD [Halopseudomonas oceani]POB00983.1 flagellar biosynthesis protein FlgD [Halopseudomonas oceani]GGE58081.1 basal-body rod modification protein FlgD [Halopseudomonas oceani]